MARTRPRSPLHSHNNWRDSWGPFTSQTVGGITTSYTYDGTNRRVTKTDTTGTNTYIYDGGDLLEEISTAITGGDAVETTAGGTVLNRITAAGQSYLHPDANANVGEVTDANGLTITRNAYSPWGNRTTIGSTATDPYLNRHGFAGTTGVRDDSGGLIDMRNRMYDPSLGIFISRDPIETFTHEAYRYVGGNPVALVDPYGLCWPDSVCEAVGEAWDETGGELVSQVNDAANNVADWVGNQVCRATRIVDPSCGADPNPALTALGNSTAYATGCVGACVGVAVGPGFDVRPVVGCCSTPGVSVLWQQGPPSSGWSAGVCRGVCVGGSPSGPIVGVAWPFTISGWAGYYWVGGNGGGSDVAGGRSGSYWLPAGPSAAK